MRTEARKVLAAELLEELVGPLTFGRFLRVWRERNEWTQVEAAARLGLSKATLCDIEKGRQPVSVTLARRIARKLGASENVAIECCLQDQLRKARVPRWRVKLVA
jgi:DNA-binding XRE family transcriptional regulator